MATQISGCFSQLSDELTRRAARAVMSQLGLRSEPLRRALRSSFERPPGAEGSFLSEPVFEATFGWEEAADTLGEIGAKLLSPQLVKAMSQPPKGFEEHRFASEWHPYVHQIRAWEALQREPPRSVIVTSGTGSGKTECFLVPILNDLARQRERSGRLAGVRALLLYPLNALINSQRDRLRAWTAGFRGDLRFCLYNGETPEEATSQVRRAHPQEVLERRELRADPPPILVTNATMLEYMLVRSQDAPILAASRGRLNWIVLDEAHTYIGSQAAELGLLIRRVMHAFEVEPEQVRFVATSATLSSTNEEGARDDLRAFLADVAGIATEQVEVIEGTRRVPEMHAPPTTSDPRVEAVEQLFDLSPEERYEVLTADRAARRARSALVGAPRTLGQVAAAWLDCSEENVATEQMRATLRLLDAGASAVRRGSPFLPLRAHLFHRTLSGLWACCNRQCSGRRATPLDDEGWVFGKVFHARREKCNACDGLVFELVLCNGCGSEFLAIEELARDGKRYFVARGTQFDLDEFEQELDRLEEEDSSDEVPDGFSGGFPRLGTGRIEEAAGDFMNRKTGELVEGGDVELGVVVPVGGKLRCPCCKELESRPGDRFWPARAGAPFFLSVALPTLLQHVPAHAGGPGPRPMDGRRVLTFSDSRQGTARFAVKSQLDAERNHTRSILYHQVAAARQRTEPRALEQKRSEVAKLEGVNSPALSQLLEKSRRELAAMEAPSIGRLSWPEAVRALDGSLAISSWLATHWSVLSYGQISQRTTAEFFLFRELVRRPRRQNSLETLGLVALGYERLDQLQSAPAIWRQRGWTVPDWRAFLKICVDFFVRAYSAVDIPPDYLNWMGLPFRPRYLLGPEAPSPAGRHQVRWPQVRHGSRPSGLVRLLALGLELDLHDPSGAGSINEILAEAWQALIPLLTAYGDGHQLALGKVADLREVKQAWLCPYTRRLLDTTFRGFTPYLPQEVAANAARCRPVPMPSLPYPFWKKDTGSSVAAADITQWLESDPDVVAVREIGVWPELSDRIAQLQPYYRSAEHSAQLSATRLAGLEREFKDGRVNLLSCSTTMELGVDIGGLTAVAMNNTPPAPSRFLQRAGRAGRRGEAASFSLTLCKSNPHGEAVFRNPLWPFTSPLYVPQVSFQSERIVMRHVNSLALASFLVARYEDVTRLTAGWFFEAPERRQVAPVDGFTAWLRDPLTSADARLTRGVQMLLRRTCLDGVTRDGLAQLWATSTAQMLAIRDRWREEVERLESEREEVVEHRSRSDRPGTAELAIELQLKRIRDEYLLRELATKGFLPGYGFPTAVVSFIPTTALELRKRVSSSNDREDSTPRYRGYPSRELALAIRDYAPGSEVVIDGRVFRSEGVTLNWHMPARDEQVREVQAFRTAYRCRQCGVTGTRPLRLDACPQCQAVGESFRQYEYLRPGGFAVDIRQQPTNDVSRLAYVPVRDPWITAGDTAWLSLPEPSAGRYRYSAEGHVFHWTGGLHGHGFAVCLRCGRAESESKPRDQFVEPIMNGHTRLRGGRETNGSSICTGDSLGWSVKRHVWLGVESATDVFELQLSDPKSGAPLSDRATAYSIAVALRQALTEFLGVDEREIGCAAVKARGSGEQVTYTLVLYDAATGGAGFVAAAPGELERLLARAAELLQCRRECDRACHRCLLTYDTHGQVEHLDRHAALAFLRGPFGRALSLPEDARLFGGATRAELDPLPVALRKQLQRPQASEVRIFLGGEGTDWDLHDWNIRNDLVRWASEGRRVRLLIAPNALRTIPAAVAYPIRALLEGAGLELFEAEPPDPSQLIVQVGGSRGYESWALTNAKGLVPGSVWGGTGDGTGHCVRQHSLDALADVKGRAVSPDELTRVAVPQATKVVGVRSELNGKLSLFGTRMVEFLGREVPALQEQLGSGVVVAAIRYSDRYLRSPVSVGAFCSLIEALAASAPEAIAMSPLIVRTEQLPNLGRRPATVDHDWQRSDSRRDVASALLPSFVDRVDLKELRRGELQHARVFAIEWADGTRWSMHLDQGFGYWRASQSPVFPFERSPAGQAKALRDLDPEVCASSNRFPTFLFLGPV